jgi:hypothetical protein
LIAAFFLASAPKSLAVTLYSTSFSDPPFSAASGYWAGVDGWTSTDPSNGTAAVTSDGGAVYLGAVKPSGTSAGAWRRLAYDPVASGNPIVTITVGVAIVPPTNGHYDTFAMVVYNSTGAFLGAFLFDTYSQSLYYDDGTGPIRLPGSFSYSGFFKIVWTVDFSTNRTSAHVPLAGGSPFVLFEKRTFHAAGRPLNLNEIGFLWLPTAATTGDNYILIDLLTVDALPAPRLAIKKGRSHRTKGASYVLRGGQAPGDDVQIQWRTKSHRRWTSVKGVPTNWSLRVKPLQPGRNTVELRLLNAVQKEIDHQRVTITRR